MAEEHKTKTNPSGSVQQCDQRHIHAPHEWQNEFGGYFNVYCPGNDGKPKEGTVEWDIDANRPMAESKHFEEQAAPDIDPTVNLDTWEPQSRPAVIHPRPSGLERDIAAVMNRHSEENESGTPDFILAGFLIGVLDAYNKTLGERAVWRGESLELPALQRLRQDTEMMDRTIKHLRELVEQGVITINEPLEATDIYRGIMDAREPEPHDSKIVPLAMYVDGRRNEIGTATVSVTPGEVLVEGTITGVVAEIFKDPTAPTPPIDTRDDTDYPLQVPKDEPIEDRPTGRFDRYQKRGLTDNG
jgi:hypothetical protein